MKAELAIRPVKSEGISEPDRAKIYDKDLHGRFIRWREQSGTSLGKLATMLRRSKTGISQYVNYVYEGDLKGLEKDIRALLRRKEYPGPSIKINEFCKISTSKSIWEVLQFCHEKGEMGAIIGPSGVSKTLTAKRYQERKQGVSLVTVDPTKKTLTSILRAISCQAGIGVGGMSSDECLDRLIERFRDTDRLLIIDEAHFLNWEAFEVIRTIHDQAGIGICYMGMPRLYSQMRGGKGYLWDQILSRISFGRGISRIEKEDVKIITDSIHPGLQKNCLNYLHEIAQKPGRLRVMVKVLERAVEACKAEKTPITLDLLKRIKSILII